MQYETSIDKLKSDLLPAWIVWSCLWLTLAVYIFLCLTLGEKIRPGEAAGEPVLIRTVLYLVAIASFPLTNLIRHIMLRLNQTMPGGTPAHARYLATALVSMSLAGSIGVYGFVLFLLGDNLNTLFIFCGLSALALFLYRPKSGEYLAVIRAINAIDNG